MTETNMYQKGKIYKIVNDVNDDIYIGSTVKQLSNRMAGHRSSAKTKTNNIYNRIREIGIEHFKIILVELYKCESKEELRAREDYYIQLLKPAYNMVNAIYNTDKEKATTKIYNKQYKSDHSQEMADYQRKYMIINSDVVKAKKKIYDQEHSKLGSEIVHCDVCNCDHTKRSTVKHSKTKKHISNLNKKIAV
jgi:group I intron endonuclease